MERSDRRRTQLVMGLIAMMLASGLAVAWTTNSPIVGVACVALAVFSAGIGGVVHWRRCRAGALLLECEWRSSLGVPFWLGACVLGAPILLHHNSVSSAEVLIRAAFIFLILLEIILIDVLYRPQVRRGGIVVRLRTLPWEGIVAYELRDTYLSVQMRLANGGTRFVAWPIGRADRAAVLEALAEYAPHAQSGL